jgi:hypothetical protein
MAVVEFEGLVDGGAVGARGDDGVAVAHFVSGNVVSSGEGYTYLLGWWWMVV